jgi:DNA invertase Pin-like site-specific DNA recombinase
LEVGRKAAIGYVRVSTAEQTEGFGLEVQRHAIRAHARQRSLRLIGIASDEGVSGSNGLESRAGLAQALSQLERGEADVLVVARLDRLARDLVLQETIIGRLQRAGREILSVAEPDIDGDDPTRVLVRQVLGAISQYERAVIRARLLAGRAAKRAQGRYAGGRPPFGWRAEGGELLPIAEEQAAIRLAKRLEKAGLSLRKIARELEQAGYQPKKGPWSPPKVQRVLRRRNPPRVPPADFDPGLFPG